MSNVIRHTRRNIEATTARATAFGPRAPRHVVQRIEAEGYEGLIASARLQAAAYVTHTAITNVALLSGEEARLVQQCPLAEGRLKVLVDHFAGFAAYEVATFGR